MGFSSPSARSLAACPRGFENRGQQRNILGKLGCRENPVRVSKLSSQWALWGLGCDSGHVASLSCLFSLPVPGKKQMGISASLLLARSELVLGIPPPIPACPLAGSPSHPSVGRSTGRCVGFCPPSALPVLLAWMRPSGSVSLPSLQGGCEAGLAKWVGYYSALLIFLPQPSQKLCSGWDIGSFLTPPGGQFTQPVYPSCCQGSQAATMGCLKPTSVATSGSLPSHSTCLDTPIDGSGSEEHFLEFLPS